MEPAGAACATARSRRCQGGLPTHPHPRPGGNARRPWSRSPTPTPAALPRGPPRRRHPYMTPQAPRRSLPRSVSGPGSRAPPAASSSGGHRVLHLPGSPRTARPGRQSPRQVSPPPAKTWLPAGPARQGAARPAPCFREAARAAPGRGGTKGLGRGRGGAEAGQRRGQRAGDEIGVQRGVSSGWPGRAGQGRTKHLAHPFSPSRAELPVAPPPPRPTHADTRPRVKTSQLFNLHVFQKAPSTHPDSPSPALPSPRAPKPANERSGTKRCPGPQAEP